MLERKYTIFNGEEIIEEGFHDIEWVTVKSWRKEMLEKTDLWMLADRFSNLSEEQKTELTTYRQELRDLPQTYYDENEDMDGANNATDNFPNPPSWL